MEYKTAYKVRNFTETPKAGAYAVLGEIGQRIDRFIDESMRSERGKAIFKEAELCFQEKLDDIYHYGLWRCEFWGKLMISAARVCRMKQDEKYKEFLRTEAYALLKYQREDGYLSTYRDSRNVFRADVSVTVKECGWENYYNWNVWGRKYTLWGLLEAAMLLDDAHILSCAEKMASQFLSEIEALQTRVKDTGVMCGMPSCSILKPLLILYRLTGIEKYLAFCRKIAEAWDTDENECPNLIRNGIASTSPFHWYERGTAGEEWYAKAYEMMSCFDGIAELYRITGNKRYLDALKGYQAALIKYESNILGSVSYCEQFAEAALYPDAATEICDVIHWMRLNHELYTLTGEAPYAEAMERAFVNAFLAGMYEDGKSCAFFIRSQGRHWDAVPQCTTVYQHCCFNNLPRGFVNAAETCVTGNADGSFAVNFWIPSQVDFENISFHVSDGYFTDGNVTLTVDTKKETAVRLRIPAWSAHTAIRMGNRETTAEAGAFYTVTVPAGQTRIQMQFDMTPHIHDFPYPVKQLPENDYHVHRWHGEAGKQSRVSTEIMLRHPMSTLQRGPLVFARSKKIGCTEEDMFSQETVCGGTFTAECTDIHTEGGVLCRVSLHLTDGNITYEYPMCDFASAANFSCNDGKYFTLFI